MKRLNKFSIEGFLSNSRKVLLKGVQAKSRYQELLDSVRYELNKEFENSSDEVKSQRLDREKRAIIGEEDDVNYFKDRISKILTDKNLLNEWYPSYYPDLINAIFSDLYGLTGIAPWAYDWTKEYKESSSAKLIGDRLYCLIKGKSVLQEQRISTVRRGQLTDALLMASPKERKESGFHEVYLHNGIRVTIFAGEHCKPGEDIMVFRKYLLSDLSFEALASFGTFPSEAIPLFKSMCEIGFNVVFAGQVRSGKTTFLQTWQSYEDPCLEGVTVATDPETNWAHILPNAPIMQLVADGKDLSRIEKSLKRSDADYVILEEMRDAVSYNLFLGITSLGTQRSKGTIHDNNALNIPYKMATAIVTECGGDEDAIISQLYTNINYVFELYQVPENKARKRLKGIVEYRYDPIKNQVSAHRICKYDPKSDKWLWKYDIGADKEELALGYCESLENMKKTLRHLADNSPLEGETVVYPAYYKGNNIQKT